MGTQSRIKHIDKHKRVQVSVTVAVGIVLVADKVAVTYYPDLQPLVPFTGFLANLLWIWSE